MASVRPNDDELVNSHNERKDEDPLREREESVPANAQLARTRARWSLPARTSGAARRITTRSTSVHALLLVLVVLGFVLSRLTPYFLTTGNIIVILTNVAITGIVALPYTFLLISGNVDLSVGGTLSIAGLAFALAEQNHGAMFGVLAAVGAGTLIGFVNGVAITLWNINSVVATLATYVSLPGIALLLSHENVQVHGFVFLGKTKLFGVPLPVVIFATLAVVAQFGLRQTVYGRRVFAIGASPETARLNGVRRKRIVFWTIILTALSASLAGLIVVSQVGTASPFVNVTLVFDVLTAAILGGSGIQGGRGSVAGTVIAVVILGTLENGLVLLGVAPEWGQVVQGAILLFAVGLEQVRRASGATR